MADRVYLNGHAAESELKVWLYPSTPGVGVATDVRARYGDAIREVAAAIAAAFADGLVPDASLAALRWGDVLALASSPRRGPASAPETGRATPSGRSISRVGRGRGTRTSGGATTTRPDFARSDGSSA